VLNILLVNISLSTELETFVQAKVNSGSFSSASEVVGVALKLLADSEKNHVAQIEEFRAEVDRRLASLDRGGGVDGEQAFERIREKSLERRKLRS
jgi:antitoxin ParD1/3/4